MIENFAKPPITEALIDLRVEQSTAIATSLLEDCHRQVKTKYPEKKVRRVWEGKIEFREGNAPISTPSRDNIDGYLFWSEDQKQVAQFKVDGFTFSRLRPYQGWEQMYEEAMSLWETYRTSIKPLAINRVAVRYVNLIEIPAQKFELEDYFTSPPKLPSSMKDDILHFVTRFVLNLESISSKAILTMTVAPPTKPDVTGIIFDLDIFRENLHLVPSDEKLPAILRTFRETAFRIFSENLTDRTKGLFR